MYGYSILRTQRYTVAVTHEPSDYVNFYFIILIDPNYVQRNFSNLCLVQLILLQATTKLFRPKFTPKEG